MNILAFFIIVIIDDLTEVLHWPAAILAILLFSWDCIYP